MMKAANQIAKEIVHATGDYRIAMSFALKEVWRQVKLYNKKRFGDVAILTAAQRLTTKKVSKPANVYGVPFWFLSENLDQQELQAIELSNGVQVKRETTKAELLAFDTDFGTITLWTPKSIIAA